VLTNPAPFNALLWRIVAMDGSSHYEGSYSLLADSTSIDFNPRPRSLQLIEPLRDGWPVQRLQWLTKIFYSVEQLDNDVVISDLRMGIAPGYVFRFKLGEVGNPHARAAPVERLAVKQDFGRLQWVWARIWDPTRRQR
jgi:inner membrane protein